MSSSAYQKFIEFQKKGLIGSRDGQEIYLSECESAINSNKILFEQAGVGMGKTIGYLFPTIDAIMKGKVKRVVISTTTLELQEQIKKEVKILSGIMGYPVKVGILKGRGNFTCKYLVQQFAEEPHQDFGSVSKEYIDAICDSILFFNTSDKDKLIDKEMKKLSKKTQEHLKGAQTEEERVDILKWQKQRIRSIISTVNYVVDTCNVHECRPVRCGLSKSCAFFETQEQLRECEIIITNHYKLTNILRNLTIKDLKNTDTQLIEEADMFIIDEAHQLENAVRTGCEEEVNFTTLESDIVSIEGAIFNARRNKKRKDHKKMRECEQKLVNEEGLLSSFVKALERNASITFKARNHRVNFQKYDCDKLELDLSDSEIKETLKELINELQNFIELTEQFMVDPFGSYVGKNFTSKYKYIINAFTQLKDFLDYEKSNNIYWLRYKDPGVVTLTSTPKDIGTILKPIFHNDSSDMVPVILTSGTMDTGNNYSFIIDSLGLTDRYVIGKNSGDVIANDSISSPFPYDQNSICYIDYTAPTPKVNDIKELKKYYDEIAKRIANLIIQTNGNALVLFTNISDLNEIYTRTLNYIPDETIKNNILNQKDNIDRIATEHLKKEGTSLFATGSFWQGIDIKGHALSNVIVVKLPFPSLDPIVEYKVSLIANSDENEITKQKRTANFFRDYMLNQLCQAAGRLIRDKDDKGIFVILDPRTTYYWNDIKKVLPFINITTKLSDVRNFIIDNGIDKPPVKKTNKK